MASPGRLAAAVDRAAWSSWGGSRPEMRRSGKLFRKGGWRYFGRTKPTSTFSGAQRTDRVLFGSTKANGQ